MNKNKYLYHGNCILLNVVVLIILLFGSNCTETQKDFIITDDDIRLIINEHLDKKYAIDKKEFSRIMISSKILQTSQINPITVWEKYQWDVITTDNVNKDIVTIDPTPIDYTPFLESGYFVYELDRLPYQNMVFSLNVKFAEDEIHGSYGCDFEIEIN